MNHKGFAERHSHSYASEVLPKRLGPDDWGTSSIFPAVLAGLFGVGLVEMAYADGDEVCVNFFPPCLLCRLLGNYCEGVLCSVMFLFKSKIPEVLLKTTCVLVCVCVCTHPCTLQGLTVLNLHN